MPNHIQNRLKIIGTPEQVREVLNFLAGDKSRIDFEKIKPMPEGLKICAGSLGEVGMMVGAESFSLEDISKKWEALNRFMRLNDSKKEEAIKLGKLYAENVQKYGYPTWYEWSIEHWGTKWNAYQTPDERDTDDTIYFQTAWSGVPELIQEVSKKFPGVELNYHWADEDTGSNVGQCKIKCGEIWSKTIDCQCREAYELAFELWPEDQEYYKLVNGNYEYIED
jgi:hypothetical protein